MGGIKPLRKLQLGREATAGTAVVASTIWRGHGTIEDLREPVFVEEDVGIAPGTDRSYIPSLGGALDMESVPSTFEQTLHPLEASIKTVGTGVADGAGTGKIYDYVIAETTKPTIKTYTIEGGDDQEVEEMEYSFVESFELSGRGNEAWTIASRWLGRQVLVSSFTGALAVPTVEEMLFGKTKLYIDAIGGSYGGTQKSLTLLEAVLKVTSGWIASPNMDGNLFFGFAKFVRPEITLDITFEHDGSATAEKVNWRAQTPRKIQLLCQGSALTTPGAVYSFKSMIINLAGKWSKFSKIGEQNGNDIVTGTFVARYNSTAADIGNIIIVNELASVP